MSMPNRWLGLARNEKLPCEVCGQKKSVLISVMQRAGDQEKPRVVSSIAVCAYHFGQLAAKMIAPTVMQSVERITAA